MDTSFYVIHFLQSFISIGSIVLDFNDGTPSFWSMPHDFEQSWQSNSRSFIVGRVQSSSSCPWRCNFINWFGSILQVTKIKRDSIHSIRIDVCNFSVTGNVVRFWNLSNRIHQWQIGWAKSRDHCCEPWAWLFVICQPLQSLGRSKSVWPTSWLRSFSNKVTWNDKSLTSLPL